MRHVNLSCLFQYIQTIAKHCIQFHIYISCKNVFNEHIMPHARYHWYRKSILERQIFLSFNFIWHLYHYWKVCLFQQSLLGSPAGACVFVTISWCRWELYPMYIIFPLDGIHFFTYLLVTLIIYDSAHCHDLLIDLSAGFSQISGIKCSST